MPALYNSGVVSPLQVAGVIPNEVFGIAISWFAPRTPLLFRLPKVPDGSPIFQLVGHKYRPRTLILGADVAAGAQGAVLPVTVNDSSTLMAGDILRLGTGEILEVQSITSSTVVSTIRGCSGTTAAAAASATYPAIMLVGNSRTGAEDQPAAISASLAAVTQYSQTIEHPYTVGGGVQSNTLFPLSPGARTPLDQYKMDAMQNAMDDAEFSAYYGVGESAAMNSALGGTGRPKMNGIRTLVVTNKVTNATDKAAYKATSFQRDLLTNTRRQGGSPDIVVVSSNWMDAFATWGHPLQLMLERDEIFGRPIKYYAAPFLGDVTLVENSILPDFTAFSLTSAEARWRVKRPLIDEPFGKTGDNVKGHMIAELAIELDNEAHHAWLEGVTGFAA